MRKFFELVEKNLRLDQLTKLFKKDREETKPLITISREYGSGGSIIAELVAKKLGNPWRVFHDEIIEQIAKEAQLDKKLIKEIDENKIPFMHEILEDFFGRRPVSLEGYSKHLLKILKKIGERGNAIIVGRGSNFLFPHSLKIRVLADMEHRIKIVMDAKKVSEEKAKEILQDYDEHRIRFAQSLFHHDPRKAHHYDLTIKIGETLGIDPATHLIVTLAKRRFKI